MELPILNFPRYAFRMTVRGEQKQIWDPLRGCWLCCTPEEWVRQHLLRWLIEEQGAVAQHIVQEYPVCVAGMPQRADIVVMDAAMRPLLLAECKAPGVRIDQATLAQAVRYNHAVNARYIMLTNGLQHYFYASDGAGGYSPCGIPPLR